MAIGRMQMNRQLYAGGGILSLTPRSKFGLGSKLKKFVRNIIPNEISEIAVKAAPFVAPFNPLLAGAMSGIGGFDQTGSIGSSLKSGLLTYGGGQLARFLGGAGLQQGINPFAGYNPAASFGGLGSLFSSPIGTQTGLQLGQYQMFGGTPTQNVVDPGIAKDSIFVQPGQPGTTYLPTDFATEALPLEPGSITTSGQIVSGTAAQNQAALDALAKQTIDQSGTLTNKITERGYSDLFKDIISGDMNKSTSALKELGGKALTDIYTTKAKDGSREIDKLAVGATIAGGMSYYEAQKAAKEADLVAEEEQYTKAMYDADRDRWKNYYSQILTPESFGITKKASGGRVGFAYGSDPKGIPSITLTKEEDEEDDIIEKIKKFLKNQAEGFSNAKLGISPGMREDLEKSMTGYRTSTEGSFATGGRVGFANGMSNNRVAQLMALLEDPNIDDDYRKQIQDEIRLLMSKKDGGRIGYKDGSDDPYDKLASKIVSINPLQDDLESQLGLGALALAPGLAKIMSRGVPTFSSAEKTAIIRTLAGRGKGTSAYKELGKSIPEAKAIMDNPAANLKDAVILKEFVKTLFGKKDGGIMDMRKAYAMGSEIPIRQNQAGVKEMDLRNTGGFIPPIGVKEKADDIPAMLSNNEFVFTADAVRAAGGGSVNKGAQKMYALMKQLEGQVV